MEPEGLRQAIENAGFAAAGVGFLAGLVFSFNPVALASIPVSLAYVTRARHRNEALLYGAMFVLGMILTHAVLGAAAGAGGAGVAKLIGRYWGLVLGPVLIVLGLVWVGWIRLPLPALPLRARRASNLLGAFALGVPFSVAVCPICTPALAVLLGVAAGSASAFIGALLLLAFALGRAIPIAFGMSVIGWAERFPAMGRYQRWLDIGGGVLLVLAGLYLLNAYFFWIPALAA